VTNHFFNLELGIKEVYQLQGGIDKYFKEFPDGGYWQGKNYVSHLRPFFDFVYDLR